MTESPAPNPVPPTTAEMQRSLARGIAWTGGAKWLTQLVSWASTLSVAQLLGPSAYGLVGMALVFTGLVTMVTEFGLGTAVVSLKEMPAGRVAQLNGLAILLGIGGMGLTGAAAVPLAALYGEPAVSGIALAMSVTFVISALRIVPYALLQRELRFRLLALLEGSQGLLYALTNVCCAWLGFGYWTLVIGAIASQLYLTVATILARPHGFAWPRRGELTGAITFSGHVLIGRLSWYLYTNADFFIAGKLLGKVAAGAYSFAWQFASIPIDKIVAMVTRVTPAYFAAAQDDNPALRRLLLNITEGLAFLTLPATVGMALVAPEFVALALGPEWAGTVAPLQLLCVYASYRSLVTLLPQILTAKGDTRWTMWLGLVTAVVLPAAFYVGSRWGAAGIALMWILVYPFFTIPLYRRTFAAIGLGAGEYLQVLWPAVRGTALMAAAVAGSRTVLPTAAPLGVRFSLLVAVGGAVYALTTALPQRHRLRQMLALLRQPPPPRPASAHG